MALVISIKNTQQARNVAVKSLQIYDNIKWVLVIITVLSSITMILGIIYVEGLVIPEEILSIMVILIIISVMTSSIIIALKT